MADKKTIRSIGIWHLGRYFEDLDEIRSSGRINMFGAASELRRMYPDMTADESRAILSAWMATFDDVPPEDRAAKALEG